MLFVALPHWVADVERSLIWMENDVNGWACSNCLWRFPVPTLLSGQEAKGAYDRLAAAKFRQHYVRLRRAFLPPRRKQNTTLTALSSNVLVCS